MALACWARGLWWSLRVSWHNRAVLAVEGHQWATVGPTPRNVQVLTCDWCGATDVGWTWGIDAPCQDARLGGPVT